MSKIISTKDDVIIPRSINLAGYKISSFPYVTTTKILVNGQEFYSDDFKEAEINYYQGNLFIVTRKNILMVYHYGDLNFYSFKDLSSGSVILDIYQNMFAFYNRSTGIIERYKFENNNLMKIPENLKYPSHPSVYVLRENRFLSLNENEKLFDSGLNVFVKGSNAIIYYPIGKRSQMYSLTSTLFESGIFSKIVSIVENSWALFYVTTPTSGGVEVYISYKLNDLQKPFLLFKKEKSGFREFFVSENEAFFYYRRRMEIFSLKQIFEHMDLIEAVATKNIEKIRLLLSNLTVVPTIYNHAIMTAAASYDYRIVGLLLKNPRLDIKKIVENLLKNSDIEYVLDYVIRFASKNGHTEIIRLLLDDGRVDLSANNNTAIRWASENGHTEVVRLLLEEKRVDPSANDNEAIRYASENGHTEVVRLLLEDGRVDPSAKINYAIRRASENGHSEIIRLLLADSRLIYSFAFEESFFSSAEHGRAEIIRVFLVDGRVNPSADNNFAIRRASEKGNHEVVRLLLTDKRVDPSANDNEAIRLAYENEHYSVVKLLLTSPRLKSFSEKFEMKNIFQDEEGNLLEVSNELFQANPGFISDEGYHFFLLLAGPVLQNTTLKQWISYRCEELNIVLT